MKSHRDASHFDWLFKGDLNLARNLLARLIGSVSPVQIDGKCWHGVKLVFDNLNLTLTATIWIVLWFVYLASLILQENFFNKQQKIDKLSFLLFLLCAAATITATLVVQVGLILFVLYSYFCFHTRLPRFNSRCSRTTAWYGFDVVSLVLNRWVGESELVAMQRYTH